MVGTGVTNRTLSLSAARKVIGRSPRSEHRSFKKSKAGAEYRSSPNFVAAQRTHSHEEAGSSLLASTVKATTTRRPTSGRS
jgi:hypothetical protein